MSTEKQIENIILTWLNYQPNIIAWKNNNVGIYDTQKKCFRKSNSIFQQKSVSDIIGHINGKFLGIEVKTPTVYKFIMKNIMRLKNRGFDIKNKTYVRYAKQVDFILEVNRYGGIAGFASSVEDARNIVNGKNGL